MRRRRWMAFTAALATAILPIGIVYLAYSRDEPAFMTYLQRYGDGSQPDNAPEDSDNSAAYEQAEWPALIAAGDAACGWLSHQKHDLWHADRTYWSRTLGAYFAEHAGQAQQWSGAPDESAVVVAAWTYLCPATRVLHEPHPLRLHHDTD